MKIFKFALMAVAMLTASVSNAQYNRTTATVKAQNYDVSDNLDLQAVASIFGDSRDLEDFERRLNDPSAQISNLDLNNDNYVDYLRVVEVGEGDVRVVVIQAVLGQDTFQDVATIEMERQRNKTVQVQIVGNSYIYGPNYIYEPYYYSTPVFFDMFWLNTYRPYYSPWYWGYYPTYFSYWRPMPIFSYHRHIYGHINHRNRYSYTDNRRLVRADRMMSNVRGNAMERSNPNRSFAARNENITNRRGLETNRGSLRSNETQLNNRSEGIGRSENSGRTFNLDNRNLATPASNNGVSAGRQRVSSEEFSRARSNNATFNRANQNTNVGRLESSGRNTSTFNSRSERVNTSNARIERSSRISTPTQSNRTFSQPSSSPSFNRSSAPSMSRGSSSSMGSGRSSSGGGMTRGR